MIASSKHTGRLRFRPQLSWRDCLTTILALAAAAGPVVAQPNTDTEDTAHGSDDGSVESWQPVSVITREDIETSGIITLDELIGDRSDYNSFGLRYPLSRGYRTLINGRYPAPRSLDLLPLSTVERIEILNNGTAAMNDGVAGPGAINIVLRRDYEGFEVAALGGLPQASGGSTGQASLLWGGNVGSGRLMLGVDSVYRGEVPAADRDYSRSKWSEGGSFAEATGVSIGGNTVSFGDPGREVARVLGDCPTDQGYTGVLSNPRNAEGQGCGFPYANIAWTQTRRGYLRRLKSNSVFTNFDVPLGDAASVYMDGRLTWAETAFRYAPSVGTFKIPNPSPDLLAAAGADAGPLTVSHRFLAHGNRDWTQDLNEHDVTVGVQATLQDNVSWDLSVNRYHRKEQEIGNTFVSESLATEAIEAGEYDLTNPRSTDPDHRAAVRKMALSMNRDEVVDVTTVKAALQGTGLALLGGNLQWTLGFEIENREEKDVLKHQDRAGNIYPVKDALGSGGSSYQGSRSRRSGFAEVQFPPLPHWTVLLAAQLDDYDDVGSTHGWTVASAWRANELVTLHGSFHRGLVPPSLADLHKHTVTHPRICDTKNHTNPQAKCDITQYKTLEFGNSDLKPSKSTTWSLGGTTELGPLSLAADWFRIEQSDLPRHASAQSIVDREARQGSSDLVTRTNDVITEIRNPLVNTGESRVSGLSLSGSTDLGRIGDVAAGLNVHWAYVTESESRVDGILQPGDFPRHRVHATLRMSRDNVVAAWHTRAVSGYDNDAEGSTGRFAPWIGHDFTLELRDLFNTEGLALQGGVLNLTDRGPSVDSASPGSADTRLDSVRGRTFFLRTELSW